MARDPVALVELGRRVLRLEAASIEESIAVNLTAPVVLANLFLRTFADDRVSRRIVNVSSGAAQSPLPGEAL